jgi:exopolysaccharide biosynthesis polyprenyl glycosylphosphotransferase
MFRRFSTGFALFSILLDAVLVVSSLYAAALLRPYLNKFSFINYLPTPVVLPWVVYLLAAAVWVGVLMLLAVYDGRKNYRVVDELSSLTIGSLLAGVSLAGVLYLSYREVSRALFLVFFIFAYLSLLAWRLAVRLVFRLSTQKVAQRRVLIVGSGPLGQAVGEQVRNYENLGWVLAGYLDDDLPGAENRSDVLGALPQARQVVQERQVDDVLIALPQGTHETTNRLVAELHDLPVKIWAVPDYFNLSLQRAQYENFAGLAMLDLQAPALSDYQRLVKRLVDLVLGVLLLFPAALLMGIISLAIRLESRAPAIFKQARVGENGQLFFMYKFRTMVPGAEQLRHLVETTDSDGNLIHKQAHDPRVTRVGRFLRRSSLDELPQLFNVLKGEMSLVGPRPELPYLVERYELWQRRRFVVPQGLTGWWQVNGRSDHPMHLHTEDDLYYIQHYSLGLDFKILLMTVIAVLRGRGAF